MIHKMLCGSKVICKIEVRVKSGGFASHAAKHGIRAHIGIANGRNFATRRPFYINEIIWLQAQAEALYRRQTML
ncbi:hypothetical protein DESC_830068 [Desulfosarcina cetonica]|uniref:hypothetical protein n=1 Tax=Desulfosarcina cetonica TaxID=90730 RepID=UPI0012EE66E5|nr:hypothetical protein [Desulfosarcina cetonica]VTR70751.1 hypothetical protein DESC_830068 [Desulfosarcina cetonica]